MTVTSATRRAAALGSRALDAVFAPIEDAVEARPMTGGIASFVVLTAAWVAVFKLPSEGVVARIGGFAAVGAIILGTWGSFVAALDVIDSADGLRRLNYMAATVLSGLGFVVSASQFGEHVLSSGPALFWLGLSLAFGSLMVYLMAVGVALLGEFSYRRVRGAAE